jgi:DNA-binding transcriptional LysR family regulator
VSQQIKALERELGVELFDRTSRSVTLTDAGEELQPLARQLLADALTLKNRAQQSARRIAGRARVGFLGDEYRHPAGECLFGAIRVAHPRIQIEFRQIDFAYHQQALIDGEVDVTFIMGPAPMQLAAVPLFESPRKLAVPDIGEAPSADDLPIVLPNQIPSAEWRRAWTPPRRNAPGEIFVVGADSMEAMLSVVGAGRGICVVPEYVRRFYPQPDVRFVDRSDLPPCVVEFGALSSKQYEPVIGALLRVAADHQLHGSDSGWSAQSPPESPY